MEWLPQTGFFLQKKAIDDFTLTRACSKNLGSIRYWPEMALFYEKGTFFEKRAPKVSPSIQSLF